MKISELLESDDEHYKTLAKTGVWGERGAGCILLCNDTKKLGIAHRSPYVQSPNTLGTIGGAVNRGDDTLVTTKKEVFEEVGYRGPLELIPILNAKRLTKANTVFEYQNYLGIVPKQFDPVLNWENTALYWLTLDELLDWASNPKVINGSEVKLHTGLKLILNDPSSMSIIRNHLESKEKLDEGGGSDVLYYYRGLRGAYNILNDNEFTLSSSTGVGEEEKIKVKGKPYFLSTTRSKVGDYHRNPGNGAVMFVLDGRWINQRYTVKPVDYWFNMPRNLRKGDWSKLDPTTKKPMWLFTGSERTSESEDRIYSSNHTMPLTPVVGVHIYFDFSKGVQLNDENKIRASMMRGIILNCQKRNIPVYIYYDVKDWLTQNKTKAVSTSKVLELTKDLEPPKIYRGGFVSELPYWIELIKYRTVSELSEKARKLSHDLVYRYYDLQYSGLKNDLHNNRKPYSEGYEDVLLINKYMIKNNINTANEFIEHIKNKWTSIYKEEK